MSERHLSECLATALFLLAVISAIANIMNDKEQ